MKVLKLGSLFFTLLFTISCQAVTKKDQTSSLKDLEPQPQIDQNMQKAYFASGCFWCVEAIFESIDGVKEVVSGYSGGKTKNPTYYDISRGNTGHAEAVEIYYNPDKVSFEQLVQAFFESHDPTALNRQGPDVGTQYRSIAFYQNDKQKEIIEKYIQRLETSGKYLKPIVTEVIPFEKFWPAEDYHQDYEAKNPNNPYIKNVSVPRLNRFKEQCPFLLKKETKNKH
ncbi:peptide-methionine (S)-S-oxide reductase [Zhouia amylolytica]|uniref:Peptide methionine sulfoxide reductase MsrA n=1 Tax=Zhouia amylolytica TaxID=376730 RepID=A0A1I6QDH2_9FLAO|nr:peptide-methionine (S)-S-oxide reductase MsrA [Zhouia amylolytica]MCQ0111321.1 peptide-methionine (S)-S-oxide reductase MsrA [Zhouia amylolytica]SFS50494.1 peptide-methionine (S)-S-oxide reductase [Zhouia amylolytica]